jgi:hypothetical protein
MNTNNPQAIIQPLYEHTHTHQNVNMGHISFEENDNLASQKNNQLNPQINSQDQVWKLANIKQAEYAKRAKLYRYLHYFLLIGAGCFSILTPALLSSHPTIAQISSILTGIFLVIEYALKPKEKWATYSKATDLIQLQLFKATGVYNKNKILINTIMDTEAKLLEIVPDLNEVLSQIKANTKKPQK